MFVVLFVLGLILAVAGVAMVAFGIPNHEFGLGNLLIAAGTTTIVGGLLLIGLASIGREMRRIAESLSLRPGLRRSRPAEQFEMPGTAARNSAAPGRVSFPSRPESRSRSSVSFEQRLAAAPAIEDDAPLSPKEPSQARMESRFGMMDPEIEPRAADMRPGFLGTEVMPISDFDTAARPVQPGGASKQNKLFESLWPPQGGPSRPSVEPKMPMRDTGADQHKEAAKEPKAEPAREEPHAVSILKSGVVDGMAYTLYSDGAIEAEMPQGTMRFASITELRAYLDKSA